MIINPGLSATVYHLVDGVTSWEDGYVVTCYIPAPSVKFVATCPGHPSDSRTNLRASLETGTTLASSENRKTEVERYTAEFRMYELGP